MIAAQRAALRKGADKNAARLVAPVRQARKRPYTPLFAAPVLIPTSDSCRTAALDCRPTRRRVACLPHRRRARAHASASSAAIASAAPPATGTRGTPVPILHFLSTLVGILVLIGSVLYKLPQVIRILRRRSARGISVLMYALETLGQTFCFVYFFRRAFPFSTYGETLFIMLQNVFILGLIVRFENLPLLPSVALAGLFGGFLFFAPFAPIRVLMGLQVASIPLLNLAKIPQIALNWRRADTGELSPATLGLQLLGNVARIFTTVAQVRDPLMLISTLVATCFNAALFVQWIYYSRVQRFALKSGPS